jgi:hypothetical protein
VVTQPQVLRDHGSIPGIGFGPGKYLAFPPGRDRVRLHWHHRVPSFQQHIHQPTTRALDPDRDTARLTELGQAADQPLQAVGVMAGREARHDLARLIHHTYCVLGGSPADPSEQRGLRQRKRQLRLLIKVAAKTRRGGRLPDGH